ncbi:MAG: T9SS type A sorting domain-containing protein [Bacteroidia bacterium]|nr:T9SS type A sorting domain-containing protein [Bacteroidia bacterium]
MLEIESDPIAGSEKVVRMQLDNLSSGIYIANVSSGDLTTTRKIVVE